MAALCLRFCLRAPSSCGKWGPLFIAVRGPLIIADPLVGERRLQTRRLSNCGSQAQLLRGTWDPPRPGLEPVSPPSAGRLPTTEPPGKPRGLAFHLVQILFLYPISHHQKEMEDAIIFKTRVAGEEVAPRIPLQLIIFYSSVMELSCGPCSGSSLAEALCLSGGGFFFPWVQAAE